MHQSKVHMIPIFYDVRPSEVRRTEQGVFRSAFEEAEKSMQKEEWKFFLQKTGYLSGWKFSDFRGLRIMTIWTIKGPACSPKRLFLALAGRVLRTLQLVQATPAFFPWHRLVASSRPSTKQ